MKVLFLDFDGVLNSRAYPAYDEHRCRGVSPFHVHLLNQVIAATDCKVVVSSAWRVFHPIEELRTILAKAGFKGEVIGTTPKLGTERGLEIQAWLDKHPEVESFAIVDDDADMAHLLPRLVQTKDDFGLRGPHVPRLAVLLNGTRAEAA